MRTFLLIGGIGAGKSSVSAAFADLGAYTFDLDQIGHDVLRRTATIGLVKQAFGDDVIDASGQIDRSRLAAKAFASDDATERLNGITHPAIMEEAQRRVALASDRGYPFAVVEVSAYDGPSANGFYHDASGIIAVVAPEQMRIERACAKGFSKEDVIRRIAQQPSDVDRRRWADFVIENDADLAHLKSQVQNVYQQIATR